MTSNTRKRRGLTGKFDAGDEGLFKVGIDIGGTFTDTAVVSADETLQTFKVLTTPGDPSVGMFQNLQLAANANRMTLKEFIKASKLIVYSSTIAPNALV